MTHTLHSIEENWALRENRGSEIESARIHYDVNEFGTFIHKREVEVLFRAEEPYY
jgi:hypothetical protein